MDVAEARLKIAASWEEEVRLRVKVAGKGQRASALVGEITCSVVFRRHGVVVGRIRIGAAKHFLLVTHAVAIVVVDAVALTIHKRRGRVGAIGVVGNRGIGIVVARGCIGAPLTAREVTRCDVEHVRVGVVVAGSHNDTARHQARTVVVGGVRVVAGVGRVGTSCNLILVTDAISIHVVQANAIAVQAGVREFTAVVVQGRVFVVVASRFVGTACATHKLTFVENEVLCCGVVVASE